MTKLIPKIGSRKNGCIGSRKNLKKMPMFKQFLIGFCFITPIILCKTYLTHCSKTLITNVRDRVVSYPLPVHVEYMWIQVITQGRFLILRRYMWIQVIRKGTPFYVQTTAEKPNTS